MCYNDMTVFDSVSDRMARSLKQQFQWLSSKSFYSFISAFGSYT